MLFYRAKSSYKRSSPLLYNITVRPLFNLRRHLYLAMKHTLTLAFVGILSVGALAQVQAQEHSDTPSTPQSQPASDSAQIVEVSGIKNPELKPYRQMAKGIDAFEKYRDLAPAAALRFQLLSDARQIDFGRVTLGIAGKETDINLQVANDGTFTLPRLAPGADANSDIVSNLAKEQLRWRGDIRSPNVPENARRMGDLRLECEISWAINREDMPFMTRNSLSLIGGLCHSKLIGLRSQAPKPLASVTLVLGERRQSVPIDAKMKRIFMPPLADTSWSDDTLIMFNYEAN